MLYVGYQNQPNRRFSPVDKNKLLKIVGGIVFGLVVLYFVLVAPLLRVFAQSQRTLSQAKKISSALKSQDIVQIKNETSALGAEINRLEKSLKPLVWTKFIPFLGSYYSDAEHLVKASQHGSKAGELIASALVPFADALGLKGGATGNAELYAQKAVQAMPALLPVADKIEHEVKQARLQIDQVNPNRYPDLSIRGLKVKSSLVQARTVVDQVDSFMPDIKPILQHVPVALGSPKTKTYLILLQNDKELRATGGFITAYAVGRVDNGKLSPDITSDNIYNLDSTLKLGPAPEPIQQYLLQKTLYIRDSNLSPDFKVSATEFAKYYNQSPGAANIDGVVAIDTEFIRALIEASGPLYLPAYQETFTASQDSECGQGFPDLVCKIEKYTSQNLNVKYFGDRKKILGELMQALLKQVLSSSKDKFEPLLTTALTEFSEKHIMFYSYDTNVQNLVEKYNHGGRIKEADNYNDYLHINQSNFGGGKSNGYIDQEVEQDIQVDASGTVKKTITIKINNKGKFDEHLNTGYRNWMRFYTPKGAALNSGQGEITTLSDLGKTVFANFSKTDPGKSSRIKVEYTLPNKIANNSDYKMLIQKQPGVDHMPMVIKLNGKEVAKFDLTTDREVSFKVKF